MIKWCFLPVFLAIPFIGMSQVGLNLRYIFGQSDVLETEQVNQNGAHASIEYNFRLKEKRLEFRPGLGYRFTFNSDLPNGHFKAYDLDFGVAIYPFDFGGDCDCPTFSKEGNLMKKGFFLEIVPGLSYQNYYKSDSPATDKNFLWKVGGAAGLDIGISDRFTLTPMISATMLADADWENLGSDASTVNVDDFIYYAAGLRFTYNQDDKKRRRRN